MASISLCMIVKDEEEVLGRCLKSAAGIADQIVVADTGSRDGTKEIAAAFTDQVYDFAWTDDFAAARNFSFSKGTGEYLMWLDADDVIPEPEAEKILRLKKHLDTDPADVVMLKYAVGFDGNGCCICSFYRERIIRRCPLARWTGRVHEAVMPFGRIIQENIRIEHRKVRISDPGRNLRIFEKMLCSGESFGARELYYYGKELYFHGKYQDAVKVLETFLGHPAGGFWEKMDACRHQALCFYGMKKKNEARRILDRALKQFGPEAELCCDMGWWYFSEQRYREAAVWYLTALKYGRQNSGSFQRECHGLIPCRQLGICFEKMGMKQEAAFYRQLAVQQFSTCSDRGRDRIGSSVI